MGGQLIVLVGLPGAGKTTIGKLVSERSGFRLLEIEGFRDQHIEVEAIAERLAECAKATGAIFECTGAADDFEDILESVDRRGVQGLVVHVHATVPVALSRLNDRDPYLPPKSGHGWEQQVLRTRTVLGLVPTDMMVSTEGLSPIEASSRILDAMKQIGRRVGQQESVRARYTITELSKWQLCGREYAYRYQWEQPFSDELPSIVGVGIAVHDAIADFYRGGARPGSETSRLADLPALRGPKIERDRQRFRKVLEEFFAEQALLEQKTLAVESDVELPLTAECRIDGRLDRLSISRSGELEVTEYKLYRRSVAPNVSFPGMLQVATYAAAELLARNKHQILARLHFLEDREFEQLLITSRDVRRVRLALLRWIRALERKGFVAVSGRHCRSCGYRSTCPFSAIE